MVDWLKNVLHDTHIDFVGYRKIAGYISVTLVIASWVVFFTVKPNWGIDFTGGTEIHLRFEDPCLDAEGAPIAGCTEEAVGIGDLRAALRNLGLSDDAVQRVGSPEDHEFIVRIQDYIPGLVLRVQKISTQGDLPSQVADHVFNRQ